MRAALTGTPGTGKTTVAALLPFRVIDLNSLVREEELTLGIDPDRGCMIADVEALAERLQELAPEGDDEIVVLEGHFSHQFASEAVVLRTRPQVLKGRLLRRGYSEEKVRENLEAEFLDVILVEAVEWCDLVSEIDATCLSPEEVADRVVGILRGELKMPPGEVDWTGEMEFDP
ncbi:adenylate kinase family protein [Candidatus Methanocrinis natronophilus]|uniref:Putative adenylate kinase n=1 Tax=Candidatus Methanocrinis natronophilus TaxID=3033396 RepID=A0ABT5X9P4_9EURY|nr:adenylate kinase family protein [Candidatus Methanocrinis natronophilus]MDF0591373.1 adenylate kinase family protein [Candidatus Methanocrinis natronophilus]